MFVVLQEEEKNEPRTVEQLMAERLRLQRLQEDSDLQLAREALGNDLALGVITCHTVRLNCLGTLSPLYLSFLRREVYRILEFPVFI